MIRILIALDDQILGDLIATAFKQFPGITSYRVPPHRVCEVISSDDYDAVVVELLNGDEVQGGIVSHIRQYSDSIEVMGLVDRSIKDKFNRFKLEYSVFSIFGMPIDPFALAKNITRFEKSLRKKSPSR